MYKFTVYIHRTLDLPYTRRQRYRFSLPYCVVCNRRPRGSTAYIGEANDRASDFPHMYIQSEVPLSLSFYTETMAWLLHYYSSRILHRRSRTESGLNCHTANDRRTAMYVYYSWEAESSTKDCMPATGGPFQWTRSFRALQNAIMWGAAILLPSHFHSLRCCVLVYMCKSQTLCLFFGGFNSECEW